jgi:hypothetical protein
VTSILDKAKAVERAFPWSLVGAFLGILGIIAALVIYYLGEVQGKADLRVYLRSEQKLVEIRESLPDLQILYKGKDILDAKMEIKIATLTFVNHGREILQGMYDENVPFGVEFSGSTVIATELLDASSEHLLEHVKLRLGGDEGRVEGEGSTGNSVIIAQPIPIFDRGSYLSLKVFLLQEEVNGSARMSVLGKIAGQNRIPLITEEPVAESDSTSYLAVIVGLLGALVTVGSYCMTLRSRAKTIDKSFMMEHLQEEIDDLKAKVSASEGASE